MGFEWNDEKVKDANDNDNFSPMPAGVYEMIINKAEEMETSTGGECIKLELEVSSGKHQGRKVFERLNFKNSNETAERIAWRNIDRIGKAFKKEGWKWRPEELIDRVIQVELKIGKPNQNGDVYNEVKTFLTIEDLEKKPKPEPSQKTPF